MATLALFLTLVLTPAQTPADVQIRTSHPKIKVGALTYHRIRPGKAMKIQVNRKAGEQLTLDVIRLGKASQKKGKARISVRVGRKEQKLNVRANLEDALQVGGGLLASYPVRHRVSLPFKANAVRITVVDGEEGVAVRVFTRKQKRSRLNLASIGLDKKTKKSRKRRGKRGRKRGKKNKKTSRDAKIAKADEAKTENTDVAKTDVAKTENSDVAKTENSDVAKTENSDVAKTENSDEAKTKNSDEAKTENSDEAKTVEVSIESEKVGGPKTRKSIDQETESGPSTSSLPILLHAQMGGGGWALNGVSPISATFSARTLLYVRGGFWERYGVGLGFDVGFQGASGSLGENRPLQWNTWMGKVRLEAEAVLLDSKRARSLVGSVLPVDVELGVLAGAGMAFGSHDIRIGNLQKTDALFGPTFRLGAFAGVGLGPGSLTFTVPVDVSVAFSSEVSGFVPIEGALLVGYRLDL